jgi:hypothetical protein
MCTAAESDAIDAAPPAASLGENNGNFIEPTSHTKIITSALRIGENLIAHKPQRQSPKHKSPHGCMQNTIHYLIQKCNLKACTTQGRQRTGVRELCDKDRVNSTATTTTGNGVVEMERGYHLNHM